MLKRVETERRVDNTPAAIDYALDDFCTGRAAVVAIIPEKVNNTLRVVNVSLHGRQK